MVPGYTLTTFPNIIYATTAASKSKGKATTIDNQQKQQKVVHSQRGKGTAHHTDEH